MTRRNERTAIVTGAARRIGAAVAQALIGEGWTVVAHVHRAEDSVPQGAIKAVADLAEADCADRILAVTDALPAIGLLVNNAARFAWDGPHEFNAEEFDLHMAVNTRAPIALTAALAQRCDGSSDVSVVNLLDAKVAAPNPDYLSYTLSKAALSAWTEIAARAYAARGMRVNAVAPALMLQSPGQSEANYRAMHQLNPLGRGVDAEDVIGAIRYLASAPTVTGQTLLLDSGQRFMALPRDVQFLEFD